MGEQETKNIHWHVLIVCWFAWWGLMHECVTVLVSPEDGDYTLLLLVGLFGWLIFQTGKLLYHEQHPNRVESIGSVRTRGRRAVKWVMVTLVLVLVFESGAEIYRNGSRSLTPVEIALRTRAVLNRHWILSPYLPIRGLNGFLLVRHAYRQRNKKNHYR